MKNFETGLKLPLVLVAALLAISPSAWARGGGHGGGHSGGHFGSFCGARHSGTIVAVPRASGWVHPHGTHTSVPGMVVWGGQSFVPAQDASWSASVPLDGPDRWTEADFGVWGPGRDLALEVRGTAALAWAEIVFHDGTSEVVDFENNIAQAGLYQLLEFDDVRLVDHVRVMARGVTEGASVNVAIQR